MHTKHETLECIKFSIPSSDDHHKLDYMCKSYINTYFNIDSMPTKHRFAFFIIFFL